MAMRRGVRSTRARAALGWHAEVFVDAGRLPELVPVFEGTPIAVALDHFGNPAAGARAEATFDAAARLACTRAVWCKLSAPYRLAQDRIPRGSRRNGSRCSGPTAWCGAATGRGRATRPDGTMASSRPLSIAGSRREVARAVLWDNPARLYRFA